MAATTSNFDSTSLIPPSGFPGRPEESQSESDFQVIRRNGSFSPFDSSKISVAITKAFVAVEGTGATSLSSNSRDGRIADPADC